MKKNLCLVLFVLLSHLSFSQKDIDKNWGPWIQISCHSGLYLRSQYDHHDANRNMDAYLIEIQNRYDRKVNFSYFFYNPNLERLNKAISEYTFGDASPTLEPGKIHRQLEFVLVPGAPVVKVFNVCFVFNNLGQRSCHDIAVKGCGSFAECDNGIPIYKIYTYTEETPSGTGTIDINDSRNETVSLGSTQQQKQQQNPQLTQGNTNVNPAGTQSVKQTNTTGAVVSELTSILQNTSEQRKIYEQQEKERLARVQAEQMAQYTEYQNKMKQTEEYKTFEKAVPIKTRKAIVSNVTVQYIIAKYINAIGGLEKLKAIKSVVQRASDGEYLIRGYGQYATNKWSHIQFKGIKFNGTEGYYDDFFGGKKIKIKKNSASFYKKTQPFDILMLQQMPDLVLAEIVVFRGKECYTIIENNDFDEEIKEYYGKKEKLVKKHFFDISDGLWIGSEETVLSKDTHGNYVSYIYFDDFREVDGILFPFIKTTLTQNRTDSFATTGIGIDMPLTDLDFEDNPPVLATLKKIPSATNKNNHASHIIGKWADILITSSDGKEKEIANTLYLEYKANGEVFLWEGDELVDLSFKKYWSITGNLLTFKSVFSKDHEEKDEYEIVTVDRTKLVMKTKNSDGTYSIVTSKRIE